MTIKLTKREQEIFDLLKVGMSNKQIAGRINISESTVKLHVGKILKKYGARSRQHLILSALKGLSPSDVPDVIPQEAEPFGWVHRHGGSVVGIMFTKKSPNPNWEPIYIKRRKE